MEVGDEIILNSFGARKSRNGDLVGRYGTEARYEITRIFEGGKLEAESPTGKPYEVWQEDFEIAPGKKMSIWIKK